jgi:hypothetical protein
MIAEIDNVIPPRYQDHIAQLVKEVQWTWHSNTSYGPDGVDHMTKLVANDSNILDNGQFIHPVLENGTAMSPDIGLLIPLLYVAADKAGLFVHEILRIKINMMVQDKTFTAKNYNFPHTDIRGSTSFVYYVNDSDGDTVLFNEFAGSSSFTPEALTEFKRFSPKKGRGIFFESSRLHASCSPATTQIRYAINYNFI